MDALVEAATQGSSSGHSSMHHRHNQHEEHIEEVIVEDGQEEDIEVDDDKACTEEDFVAFKQKYGKYLPQDIDGDTYEEEYVEELIEEDEILVDDDGLLEHEEVVYETVIEDAGNERDGIDSLVALSRGPLGNGKTVREFLGDIGATEEVHSTQHKRSMYTNDPRGNVRVQAPSRLLPVATVKNVSMMHGGRVMIGRNNIQTFHRQDPSRDWREEQKRDLEICDFFDTLPADRQVAFRKMLERMGERVPKPIQGSRKFFRSTLAPHVKIPIPSNSKLEMLSTSIPIARSKIQMQPKEPRYVMRDIRPDDPQNDGNEMFYTTTRDGEKKVVVFESMDEQERPYGMAKEVNDEGEIVDVVAMQEEEIIEEDGHHNMTGEQFVISKEGDPEDQPAQLEPAFGPGEPVELPPAIHHEEEVEMPMLEKEPMPTISRPLHERWFVVPELRKELIGKQHVPANRGNIEPNQRFCEGCHQFLAKGMHEHHQKKIARYGQCDYFAPRRFPCPEDNCNHKMPNIEKLCMHLRISHKRPLDVKEQLFEYEEEFQVFLRELEGKGGNFRMSRGNKGNKDGGSVRYYRCNRNVRLKPRSEHRLAGQNDPRLQFHSITSFFDNGGDVAALDVDNDENEQDRDGELDDDVKPRQLTGQNSSSDGPKPRNKPSKLSINGVCTAFFKKTDFPDGRIHVRYCDFHLHPDALLRLPDDVRHRIRELNIKRLPVPVIIKIIKAEIHSFCEPGTVLEDRILQLVDKDVRNVLARADMRPIKLHVCRNKNILDRPSFGEQVAVPRVPYNNHSVSQMNQEGVTVTTESAENVDSGEKMVPAMKPDTEEERILCNLPTPPEPHLMMNDPEEIAREDEMLEAAVMNIDNIDPNRPPSPEALTELERAMFEEWQCEDVDHLDEMSKRRRETLLIKRKKEEVREKMNQVQILLQAEFYDSLAMDHLVRLDSIAEELFEMHAAFEQKIRAAKRRNNNRSRNKRKKKVELDVSDSIHEEQEEGVDYDQPIEEQIIEAVIEEEAEEDAPQLNPDGLDESDGDMSEELGVLSGETSNVPQPSLKALSFEQASVDAEPIENEETVELGNSVCSVRPKCMGERSEEKKTLKKTRSQQLNNSDKKEEQVVVITAKTLMSSPRKRGRKSNATKAAEAAAEAALKAKLQSEETLNENELEAMDTPCQEPPAKKSTTRGRSSARYKVASDSPCRTPASSPSPPQVSSRGRRVVRPKILDL